VSPLAVDDTSENTTAEASPAPSVAETAVAELIAVFADAANQADRKPADPIASQPEKAAAPAGASPADRPSPRKSPVKRTPGKRPALTLAASMSGDFAITAPPGTPNPTAAGSTGQPAPAHGAADQTATQAATTASGENLPPLPSLSPQDAALKFEAMPEAPEQRSVLDGQEPMRFVWTRRWPFLSLVPASHVPTASQPRPGDRRESDAEVTRDASLPEATASGSMNDAGAPVAPAREPEPENEPSAETTVLASEQLAPEEVDPPADGSAGRDGLPPFSGGAADDVPSADSTVAAQSVPAVGSPESASDPAPVIAATVVISRALESPSETEQEATVPTAPASGAPEPENQLAEEQSPESDIAEAVGPETHVIETPADEDPDVDAASVTELLDEIEAQDVARVTPVVSQKADPATSPVVLRITGLSRRFGDTVAVDGIDLDVHEGSFYGIVGPNGAGKTTTLSMVTGLLRPDTGSITVHGVDVWKDPDTAKRSIGVLPDRLRLFDRLTGAQLLYYAGVLRGLDGATVRARTKDLARAFGLEDALNRLVTDYSAGMTKKVALAAAMIHSPRLLVLDEPFESVDPVSAANVIEILQKYVAHGGTVVLSSHGMDLIQRVCDHVAIIVHGKVLAAGAVDDVRGSGTLEERFVELAGGRKAAEGMEWLHSFSD
jgi:ABC-2 type transport system ATP-binding protein